MSKLFVIVISKIIIRLSRLFGRHGSALPGLVAERLRPKLLNELGQQFPDGVVVVTGTNGKTTTTKMIAQMLNDQGKSVLTNKSGSNFTRGILSVFIEKASLSGKLDYDIAVLELDEAYARLVAKTLKPKLVLVLNVHRDQLDRYGEIEKTAELIGEALKHAEHAVLNADDPYVARLAEGASVGVSFFGVSDDLRERLPTDEELHSAERTQRSQTPAVELITQEQNKIQFKVAGQTYNTELRVQGLHNAANAAAALATVTQLLPNAVPQELADSLKSVHPAFGRGEDLVVDGQRVRIALVKNPSGFNHNLTTMLDGQIDAVQIIVNDQYADGRDVSWLWDVDFSALQNFKGPIIVSGIRAYDMALRLNYDGIETETIEDSEQGLKKLLNQNKTGESVVIFPTYTAMLNLRKALSKRTQVEDIW